MNVLHNTRHSAAASTRAIAFDRRAAYLFSELPSANPFAEDGRNPEIGQNSRIAQIAARLTGSHRCEALGIVATGHAPVLMLCRELLAAGVNPDAELAVYRNGVLSLRVQSVSAGARLTVEDGTTGVPRFRRARPSRRGAASPARKNGKGAA
jgi:hypothetical protein